MKEIGQRIYFDGYSPVADMVVIAVCIVMVVLVATSYVTKTKAYKIFLSIVFVLFLAALTDIIYHDTYVHAVNGVYTGVYIFRNLYHIFLYTIFLLYIYYIVTLQRLEKDKTIPIMIVSLGIFVGVVVTDIITTISGRGFRFDQNGVAITGMNVFVYGYMAFVCVVIFLMFEFRARLYRQVMNGFYGTMIVSFLVLLLQSRRGQNSLTVASFLFPVIAMLYLIHSNPYDIELGAVDSRALEDMIRYNYERKNELVFMSLFLPDFNVEGRTIPKEMSEVIRTFAANFFRGGVLFQINNGHVILIARKKANPDYENKINKIINAFYVEYEKFQYDYKIVMGESIEEISRKNEYISFINSIHRRMEMNSVHLMDYEDVEEFNKFEYILSELGDIYRRCDLRDSRVLAYCQPVYNLKTGKYDTAEALMRLKLQDIGMVFPDQFIPLAEENGYIHVLTEIMLQKTCDEIKYLMKEGYEVNRISVNVSVLEMRDESFTEDFSKIIKDNEIPDEKIAIEITESQSENDFMVMKNMINDLKGNGIKFYLDDFGTGYSNMERIMELPFDIIKFDRSLVIASDHDPRSRKMVASLANMFDELNYSVLYEGVEKDSDEERCKNMSASYLQGYKYSRPIPIIELKKFFSKVGE